MNTEKEIKTNSKVKKKESANNKSNKEEKEGEKVEKTITHKEVTRIVNISTNTQLEKTLIKKLDSINKNFEERSLKNLNEIRKPKLCRVLNKNNNLRSQ